MLCCGQQQKPAPDRPHRYLVCNRASAQPLWQHLIAANKLLHKAKLDDGFIIIHAQDLREALAVGGWSDASWANRVDESSTGGFVIGLCPRKILDGD